MKHTFFYIASRLAKISHTKAETTAFGEFFASLDKGRQCDFFAYCKQWKLAPWIYLQMQRLNLIRFLDSEPKEAFRQFYEKIKAENTRRRDEALNFLREFNKQNIDVAILKGNLFIESIYKDIGYKKMNDFDMLIRIDDWFEVQKIYFALNYIPLGFGWSGEKGDVAKFSHAGLSFISPNYHCITGTQWGLKSPTSKYTIDINNLWKTVSAYKFKDVNALQLSPEYNLLHLVLHMGLYKIGIRDCMDVYNLLLSEPNFDEDAFVVLCKESNAVEKAYFTLVLSNECSDTISPSLIEKLRPGKEGFISRRLQKRLRMAEQTGDMQLSYNDYFHGVEMLVFYFNLYHTFHMKLYFYIKILLLIFFPPKEDCLKLSDLQEKPGFLKSFIARSRAPFFIFALIGEEIGLGITILLFVKLFFDSIISLKNYFLRKDSYFTYLEKNGIPPKEIINAVKGIQ